MVDYSVPNHPSPDQLRCYGIAHRDTFTAYTVEKHEDLYRWLDVLTTELGIPSENEYHIWEVETDQFITHGPDEDIIVVTGDDKTQLFFKEQPDPDIMLDYIDMIEPE